MILDFEFQRSNNVSFQENLSTFNRFPLKMKPILLFLMASLAILLMVPDEADGVPPAWFVTVAARAGWRLLKRAYYARCNTR